MKLYEYFRSSCSYRLRIALNFKKLKAEQIHVNLLEGEQISDAYKAINPQGSVPTLIDDKVKIYQSIAALEYLEETYPKHALLPKLAQDRAKVRSIALAVACDIQPLNNLRVLNYLTNYMEVTQEKKTMWLKYWIENGLETVEQMILASHKYCHKDSVSMADICLVPQVYNALRFECDTTKFPKIMKVYEACNKLPAFEKARPENHKDFVG
jgi:maleylacetoacetate isomerase